MTLMLMRLSHSVLVLQALNSLKGLQPSTPNPAFGRLAGRTRSLRIRGASGFRSWYEELRQWGGAVWVQWAWGFSAVGIWRDFGFMALGGGGGRGAQVLKKEHCIVVFLWIQVRMHNREHAEVRWLNRIPSALCSNPKPQTLNPKPSSGFSRPTSWVSARCRSATTHEGQRKDFGAESLFLLG